MSAFYLEISQHLGHKFPSEDQAIAAMEGRRDAIGIMEQSNNGVYYNPDMTDMYYSMAFLITQRSFCVTH